MPTAKLAQPAKPFDPERFMKQITKLAGGGCVFLSYNPDVYRNTFVARAMPTYTQAREAVSAELNKTMPNGSIEISAFARLILDQESIPIAQASGISIEAALVALRAKLKG